METEMNDIFNERPEGEEGEKEAEASFIKDNDDESFNDLLNNPDQNLDEAMMASFREENEDDTYRRRKEQMNKLYLTGRFNDIKGEFARNVLGSEYRIDPTDGQDSMEFISRLDITKHQP
ncbi:Hypothetical predicted protein [Paramuricea clavata]|uniref:Uncharacterized protein n=1 Tax=Paramuricea clavata TaxID=317549 RepID=A0A6S7FMH9_PARCT|nr:Hypothetical predicted protein [Paramuricea clavata]